MKRAFFNRSNSKGFTLVGVLGFMTLATVIVVGTFMALSSWNKSRSNDRQFETGDLAARAGLNHTVAWLTNHPMDAASAFQTFYDKGMNDPIQLPLDSMGNSSKQSYKVYLTAMETSGTPAVPTRIKVQSIGKGKDGTSVTFNAVYSVSGIYLQTTSYASSGECGPDMALWLGAGADSIKTPLTIDSGGAYFGESMQINSGKAINVTGDLIIGDTSTASNNIQGPITVNGNMYSSIPVQIFADANHRIRGSAYFAKGVAAPNKILDNLGGNCCLVNPGSHQPCPSGKTCGTIRGNLTVDKDLTINGSADMPIFNIQNGKTLKVGRKFDLRSTWKTDGLYVYRGSVLDWFGTTSFDGLIIADSGARIDSIVVSTWKGSGPGGDYLTTDTLLIKRQISNTNEATIVAKNLFSRTGAGCSLTSSGKVRIGSTVYNSCGSLPSSSYTWRGTDTLKYIQDQLGSRLQKPIGFIVDSIFIDAKKMTWANMCTLAKTKIASMASATCSSQFDVDQANLIAADAQFITDYGINKKFLAIDWDNLPTPPMKPNTGKTLTGKWVFTKTSGNADFNNTGSYGAFPNTSPSAEIFVWIRQSASVSNWSITSGGNFYGVFLHTGTNFSTTSNNDIVQKYIGAFYLKNTGSTQFDDRSSASKFALDKAIVSDIAKYVGFIKVDENNTVIQSCGLGATQVTNGISLNYFRVTSSQLTVKLESQYSEEIPLDQDSTRFAQIQDSSASRPYLDFSISNIKVGSGQYTGFGQFLDSTNGKIVWAYYGKVYSQTMGANSYVVPSTTVTSSKNAYSATCSGNWVDSAGTSITPSSSSPAFVNNKTNYFYFKLNCTANGKTLSTTRILPVQVGVFASSSSSSSSGKSNQSISFSSPPTSKTMGDPDFNMNATATSGLPVTLSSATPSICTISGNTVHLLNSGTCTITASQSGDSQYNAAPNVSIDITVNPSATKQNQTISFGSLASKALGDADFRISVTASSGLPVAFASSPTSVCTIVDSTIHIVAAGTCTITASQAGNSSYNAAPDVSRSFTITTPSYTVNLTTSGSCTYEYSKDNGSTWATWTPLSTGFPCPAGTNVRIRSTSATSICQNLKWVNGGTTYYGSTLIFTSPSAASSLSATEDFVKCGTNYNSLPTWSSLTTYGLGAFVASASVIYKSLSDANLNQAVTNTAKWSVVSNCALDSRCNTAPVKQGTSNGSSTWDFTAGDVFVWDNNTANSYTSHCQAGKKCLIQACQSGGTNYCSIPSGHNPGSYGYQFLSNCN